MSKKLQWDGVGTKCHRFMLQVGHPYEQGRRTTEHGLLVSKRKNGGPPYTDVGADSVRDAKRKAQEIANDWSKWLDRFRPVSEVRFGQADNMDVDEVEVEYTAEQLAQAEAELDCMPGGAQGVTPEQWLRRQGHETRSETSERMTARGKAMGIYPKHSTPPFKTVRSRLQKHRSAIFLRAADGTWIGKVYGHEGQPVEHNAKLFAAAPLLLKALKEAKEHLDYCGYAGLPDLIEQAIEEAEPTKKKGAPNGSA